MAVKCPRCREEELRLHCTGGRCDWYICESCKIKFGHFGLDGNRKMHSLRQASQEERRRNGLA